MRVKTSSHRTHTLTLDDDVDVELTPHEPHHKHDNFALLTAK